MTEYPKIETIFERGDDFRVVPERLKNPVYATISEWEWTEKVDGTNIRILWSPRTATVEVRGRSDNAQLHPDLHRACMEIATVAVPFLRETWPESSAAIYGEGYGAGIQKGGGDYSQGKKFIAFDVFVEDVANRMGGWWLCPTVARQACASFGIPFVPLYAQASMGYAVDAVSAGIPSLVAEGRRQMEGLVGRPVETLYDKRGHRIICKLKTKDF